MNSYGMKIAPKFFFKSNKIGGLCARRWKLIPEGHNSRRKPKLPNIKPKAGNPNLKAMTTRTRI